MWLEAKEIEKVTKEFTSGQSEPSLEMSQEDDSFAGFGGRDGFCPGSAADNFRRDSARSDEPFNVALADVRSLPTAGSWPGHF